MEIKDLFKTMKTLKMWGFYSKEPISFKKIMLSIEQIEGKHQQTLAHTKRSITGITKKYIEQLSDLIDGLKSQESSVTSDKFNHLDTQKAEAIACDQNLNSLATPEEVIQSAKDLIKTLEELFNQIKIQYISEINAFHAVGIEKLIQILNPTETGQKFSKKEEEAALNLLAQFDYEELNTIAPLLAQGGINLPRPLFDPKAALLRKIIRQHQLNHNLESIGFPLTTPQLMQPPECRRLIITTEDAIKGLELILGYQSNHSDKNITEVTATDIVQYYMEQKTPVHISDDDSGFEIAWGLLSALIKHRSDNIFVTTSFEVAGQVIPCLSKKSTIVLDGHGGKSHVSFADEKQMSRTTLQEKIKILISLDKEHCIDHLILQSCTSGDIAEASDLDSYMKNNTALGKFRQIIVLDNEKKRGSLFRKAPDGSKSVAEMVYDSIIDASRETDMAFTFSENLINPSHVLKEGNLGMIPHKGKIMERPKWPESVLEPARDKKTLEKGIKSTSILPNAEHRKFKRDKYTKEQYFFSPSTKEAESNEPIDKTADNKPQSDSSKP